MSDSTKGIALGTAAAVLWGSTYVAIRLLYHLSDLDAFSLTFARFLIGGAALTAILVARGQGRQLASFYRDPLPFFLTGITGIAGMGLLVTIGSALTSTVNVSLLLNANPVFIALFAPLVGEPLTRNRLVGALVGLAGMAIVVLGTASSGISLAGSRDLLGSLAAVGGGLAWAAYTLIGKEIVARYGGMLTTTLGMLWGSLLLSFLLGMSHWPQRLPQDAVLVLLYLGLIPTALAFLFWYRALALVDAAVLAPTQYVAPLSTVALAWFLLGERVEPAFAAGMVLIFLGIALASRTRG